MAHMSLFSRREFLISSSLVAGTTFLKPRLLFAQSPALGAGLVQKIRAAAANATITVQKLRGDVSAMIGSGGNIAVLPGRDGKLLVDAGIPGSRPRMIEAMARISPDPITRLINTHWHFDHTDGNEWLHSAGATILAHENTQKHMATTTRVDDWDFTFPPSPAGALPTQLIKSEKTLQVNGATLRLRPYPPAHTDGDISVHFTDADVFHAGDTWWNGVYPFIDYSTGGSIDGTIRATETNLGIATAKTVIIPGHGPVGTKSQLTEFRDLLVAVRAKVAALKKQGKSLAETLAAKPTAPYDAKWGSLVPPDLFAKLVYVGV